MKSKIYQLLGDLELKLEEKLPLSIFRGYTAINKTGVEKIICEIYQTLPKDIAEAQKYLKNKNIEIQKQKKVENLYDLIGNLENKFDGAVKFANFVFVNIREIENLLDKIYANLPDEIVSANEIKD
jgi:flagellin-specific chaperone FliS